MAPAGILRQVLPRQRAPPGGECRRRRRSGPALRRARHRQLPPQRLQGSLPGVQELVRGAHVLVVEADHLCSHRGGGQAALGRVPPTWVHVDQVGRLRSSQGRVQPYLGSRSTRSGSVRPNIDKAQPNYRHVAKTALQGDSRRNLIDIGPNSAIGSELFDMGPNLADSKPNLAELGRTLGQLWLNSAPQRSEGRFRVKSLADRHCPKFG